MKITDLKAPNRKTLYEKIQRVYDLPKYSPNISMDYLTTVLTNGSDILKAPRKDTSHIPEEEVRRFRSRELFLLLEKTLMEKMLPPTGFTELNIPDIAWMLRMLV